MPLDDTNLDAALRALLADSQKIEAIKRYREATGADLATAKTTVEALERGESMAAREPSDSTFETEIVSLLEGGKKIGAIKLYRERTGVGLKEAKDAVEAIAAERRIPIRAGCFGVVFLAAVAVTLITATLVAKEQEIAVVSRQQWIRVSDDKHGFVLARSGEPFVPWGFNYDHDENGRLLEDYWEKEWPKVEADFREMKQLGANVIRIHLQTGKFMKGTNQPNEANLDRLDHLVALAEKLSIYMDITGLACYRKKDVPQWYGDLGEKQRWDAQARFWEAVAQRCANSPAIFCYDLMNEPAVPGGTRKPGEWLGPSFLGSDSCYFGQFITLEQRERPRPEIARQWCHKLVAAIRKHDRRHLVTVGLVPWSLDRPGLTSGFVPKEIASELDFIAVHLYPEKGKVKEAMETLSGFAVGKPVVIEEMFPLNCSIPEFERFLDESRKTASGWIGFYWGKTPEEYRKSNTSQDSIVLSWLELFEKKSLADAPEGKKLIEWGWDEPDTKFMRQNIENMEQLPFDGVVFHVVSSKGGNLVWEMWGKRKFELVEFQQAILDLKATPFHRLTDRFLRVNVTPGNVDWFDDQAWAVVIQNVTVAAQIAKRGGCKGFMFDVEQYNEHPFDYGKQQHRTSKTFDDYRVKVRQRGREWMKAVNWPFPDITMLLAYAYSITGGQPMDRAKASYGLVGDFLDGMLEACTPQTKFVDGWEGAYTYKKKEQFQKAYDSIKGKLAALAADPPKYRERFQAGFGIWMDCNWRKAGWHTDDLSKNFFTPADFENSVRLGLERSEEYVWIYTEQPRWWPDAKLPKEYVEALRKARGGEGDKPAVK